MSSFELLNLQYLSNFKLLENLQSWTNIKGKMNKTGLIKINKEAWLKNINITGL